MAPATTTSGRGVVPGATSGFSSSATGSGATSSVSSSRRLRRNARTRHPSSATVDTPSAIHTFRCGVQRRVTEKRPDGGCTSQPLAYPSTRVEPPTSLSATVAFQPALSLSPNTNQNGVPRRAPLTDSSILVLPLLVTFTRGVAARVASGCVTDAGSLPRAANAIGVPAASDP